VTYQHTLSLKMAISLNINSTTPTSPPDYDDAMKDSPGSNGSPGHKGEKVKKVYKRTKKTLQSNKYTQPCCPPTGEVATTLTLVLTIIAIFFSARTVLGPIADVGGTIFSLLMLILCALIGGKLIAGLCWMLTKFCKVDLRLPPLLGMLIVGIALKNVPYNFGQFGRAECDQYNHTAEFVDSVHDLDAESDKISFRKRSADFFEPETDNELDEIIHLLSKRSAPSAIEVDHQDDGADNEDNECHPRYIGHDLDPSISRTLRLICLTVILLMAGLELDPVALMKLSGMVVRATFIPCFTEALAVAVFSVVILGLPWTVGFMLGFVLAAVSPAVIIPCLMSLASRGYGVKKGIPTLVIAACSADDVVAISGFGLFLGITFNTGAPMYELIFHGPIEVIIGVLFGIFWGVLAQWIPNHDHKHVAFFRWLVLLGGGLIALFGAHLIHYDGAGGLATIIMAFVAGMQWRKEGWGDHNPVTKTFKRMWIILEPVIFALIGTEIQIDKIDPNSLGLSIVVLILALAIRMVGTYFAVAGGELNVKEKVFMAFAWMPKATVQAALGPIFLDNVKKQIAREDYPAFFNTTSARDAWVSYCKSCISSIVYDNTNNINATIASSGCDTNCFGNSGITFDEKFVKSSFDFHWEEERWLKWGNDALTLAVMSILITAPLGAVCILGLGPKLLESDNPDVSRDESQNESEEQA